MNTHKTQHTQILSYYEALAYSLIRFAQKHESFSNWLQSMFATRDIPFAVIDSMNMPYVLPSIETEQQATRKVHWLIELSEQKEQTAVVPALEVLTHWANIREREDPKAIILGLMIGVEPFGIFGEAKKKHHPIDIIVRDSVLRKIKKTTLAKMSVTLANEIVQNGLIEVKGNANLLEPELSDWFFGDKTVVFYKASDKTLASIEKSVFDVSAPHARRADKKGTTFLAVGPTFYINDLSESDTLEEII